MKIPVLKKDKTSPNLYTIVFEEGGRVPEVLSGTWTKVHVAQKAIDNWVAGYTRKKIYPRAPKNDIPQRKEKDNGEKECIS